MTKIEIISNRGFNNHPAIHAVYEWEDIFSLTLNAKIRKRVSFSLCIKGIYFFIARLKLKIKPSKIIEFLDDIYLRYCTKTDTLILRIDPSPRSASYLGARKSNVVPLIGEIDKNLYYNTNRNHNENLKHFEKVYTGHKIVLTFSNNHYNYLLKKNCSLNLKLLPYSLSDKYILDRKTYYKNRNYDLIIPGRPNLTILQWLKKFAISNPEFEYFTYHSIDNRHVYISNKGAEVDCRTREKYFELLKDCNIAVYSTQGADGIKNALDHVSPKIFEIVYTGCFVIGMYPETDDTRYFQLNQICPSFFNFEKFETKLSELIHSDRSESGYKNYVKFLDKNKTSIRAKLLSKYLDDLN